LFAADRFARRVRARDRGGDLLVFFAAGFLAGPLFFARALRAPVTFFFGALRATRFPPARRLGAAATSSR
jgi:predicted LPLAT superfamily acyltransferase